MEAIYSQDYSLQEKTWTLEAMSRSADKLKKKIGDLDIKIVKADVMDYSSLTKALEGCDVAYYLIHSMEGSSPKQWKKFAERDRKAAENFSKAVPNVTWIELFI